MLAKKFFSLLLLSLFFSIACDRGQAQFELASVRAKDLRFQQANGLQVDGIAGPITKKKIKELLGEA